MHVYERHMERLPMPPVRKERHMEIEAEHANSTALPLFQIGRSYLRDPDWIYCDFACYINWMVQYIQVGSALSWAVCSGWSTLTFDWTGYV